VTAFADIKQRRRAHQRSNDSLTASNYLFINSTVIALIVNQNLPFEMFIVTFPLPLNVDELEEFVRTLSITKSASNEPRILG
jgi:hypothetical protein